MCYRQSYHFEHALEAVSKHAHVRVSKPRGAINFPEMPAEPTSFTNNPCV